MASDDSPTIPPSELKIVTLIRVLEYTGPEKWVELTIARSSVPLMGSKEFPAGAIIKSGVVMWEEAAAAPTAPATEPQPATNRARVPFVPPPSGGRIQ